MNRFKFQAMLREFPFLAELGATEKDNIKVSRWDADLLSRVPQEYDYDGSAVNDWRKEIWHAVLPSGEIVRSFVKARYVYHSNYAHSQGRIEDGETILEALDRLKEIPSLLINEWAEHEDTSGRDYYDARGYTIYKPPKSGPIVSEMIAEAKHRAEAEVAAETTF